MITPDGYRGGKWGVNDLSKDMSKVGKGNTQVSVILPNEVHSKIVLLAGEKDWSVSQTIRNIVEDWLKRNWESSQPSSKSAE